MPQKCHRLSKRVKLYLPAHRFMKPRARRVCRRAAAARGTALALGMCYFVFSLKTSTSRSDHRRNLPISLVTSCWADSTVNIAHRQEIFAALALNMANDHIATVTVVLDSSTPQHNLRILVIDTGSLGGRAEAQLNECSQGFQ